MSLFRLLATVGVSLGAAISVGVLAAPEQPQAALHPAPAAAGPAASSSLIADIRPQGEPAGPAPDSITAFVPGPPPSAPIGAITASRSIGPRTLATGDGTGSGVSRTASDLRASDAEGEVDCSLGAELAAQPAAMLSLVVIAPCDAGEPLAISHGALLLAEPVGADGRLDMVIPALRAEAGVTLAALDGRVLRLSATVPDFDLYQRVVVSWEGPAVLDLHAFAGGAGWGEPGHVQAGGPVSAATGFVTAFGDPDLGGPQARVYTYPVGISASAGHVEVAAMIAVTEESCGRRFAAEVSTQPGSGHVRTRTVEVEMPACDGPAGFVMIPDLLPADPDLAALD